MEPYIKRRQSLIATVTVLDDVQVHPRHDGLHFAFPRMSLMRTKVKLIDTFSVLLDHSNFGITFIFYAERPDPSTTYDAQSPIPYQNCHIHIQDCLDSKAAKRLLIEEEIHTTEEKGDRIIVENEKCMEELNKKKMDERDFDDHLHFFIFISDQ